jgi:16S rRNA processing protein RimM
MSLEWDAMILVGRIARPHGIRGQVVVNPETDFVEERFSPGATFWTRASGGPEQLTVTSARVQNGRPVVAFEGFASIDDVERLAGLELRVPEEALTPLEAGTYYHHQLVGCVVQTAAGDRVGEVVRVDGGSGGSLLVVDGSRGEVLIPLATDICVDVDVRGRQITIEPPAGLLELNETKRSTRGDRSSRPEGDRGQPDPA